MILINILFLLGITILSSSYFGEFKMKLVPRDPLLNHLPHLKDINRFFNLELGDDESAIATSQWVPAVDIVENDDHFIIEADVPGVNPKDIEVSMENGALTLKGERESEFKEEKEGYSRVERSSGSFYRRFSLPETADSENIVAKSDKGVLKITVGKKETAKPKKITVNVQ